MSREGVRDGETGGHDAGSHQGPDLDRYAPGGGGARAEGRVGRCVHAGPSDSEHLGEREWQKRRGRLAQPPAGAVDELPHGTLGQSHRLGYLGARESVDRGAHQRIALAVR
jgi:hypothetical protein